MNHTEIVYFGDLLRAAWKGVRSQPFHAANWQQAAIAPALVGFGMGALSVSAAAARPSFRRSLGKTALVGAAAGFGAGVLWSVRLPARAAFSAAVREVNTTRDLHWLAENPVAYG